MDLRSPKGGDSALDMSVTYEITAKVDLALCDQYERYMKEMHIPDLLRTGCFDGASITVSEPGFYRVRYEAVERGSLDKYLDDDAPRLRDDFNGHFPSRIEVTRTEWNVLE